MADEIPLKGLSNGLNRPIFLKNCPIKKIDGKWLVLKDIIYPIMSDIPQLNKVRNGLTG